MNTIKTIYLKPEQVAKQYQHKTDGCDLEYRLVDPELKAYTCKSFEGHCPMVTSAIVVASDHNAAVRMLSNELKKQGLKPVVPTQMIRVDLTKPSVDILQTEIIR